MKATQTCTVEGCERPRHVRGWCRAHYARWQRNGDPLGGKCAPAEVRFERFVDRTGECHRWTGAHHGKGYGHFRYDGKVRKAHVVALLLEGVEIPEGLTVDHVWARGCRFKDCVRVDHLEVVPGAVNILRGGNPCAVNARKTHCRKGHELKPGNLLSNLDHGRHCLTCHNAKSAAWRAKSRSPICANGHQKVTSTAGKLYCSQCHSKAHRKVTR